MLHKIHCLKAVLFRRGIQHWLITPGNTGRFGLFSGQEVWEHTAKNYTEWEAAMQQAANQGVLLPLVATINEPVEPLPLYQAKYLLEDWTERGIRNNKKYLEDMEKLYLEKMEKSKNEQPPTTG